MRFGVTIWMMLCMAVGCAPQHYAIRPGVTGQVVDSISGQPISGATVALEGPLKWNKGEYSSGKYTGHADTTSNNDGHFAIAPLMIWGFRPPSDEAANAKAARINIQKPGYSSQHVLFNTVQSSDVGVIALKHK